MFFSSHKSHIFKKSRSTKNRGAVKKPPGIPLLSSVGSLSVACFMLCIKV